MRDCLNDILNENLLLTLAQINREPKIHDCTVASAFERMLFRVKLVRPLPAERNRPHVIQRRAGYTNLFMRYPVVNHSVFVDEYGYNIWTARSHGRAVRGKRTYRGFVDSVGETSLSQWQFLQQMALFSILGSLEE